MAEIERNAKHIKITFSDSPLWIFIIKSGWEDYYHVIQEDPENGDYDHTHELLRHDKVCLRYDISL